MFPLKVIVHPTDFSAPSQYAFRLACALAHDHHAKLIIAHVAPPILAYGEMVPPLPPEDYTERIWEDFRKLQATEPLIREVLVETKLAEGDPVEEILAIAKETGCDLIVMGTHGRSGLKRVLLGSVAELVLRKAPCPVLTVKAPAAVKSEPVPELIAVP